MSKWECLKLQEFLALYPKMRLVELGSKKIIIEGEYELDAQMKGFEAVRKSFSLQVIILAGYPRILPIVKELGKGIPRTEDFHTYRDGSFCLGSDINLKSILSEFSAASEFVEKILDPFLYSVTYKLLHGIYPYGDLAHGEAGLVDDYQHLFTVNGKEAVLLVLTALGKRKRDANKLVCPCGCNNRIGKCDFRFNFPSWRQLDRRRWFRNHLSTFTPLEKPKKTKRKRK